MVKKKSVFFSLLSERREGGAGVEGCERGVMITIKGEREEGWGNVGGVKL